LADLNVAHSGSIAEPIIPLVARRSTFDRNHERPIPADFLPGVEESFLLQIQTKAPAMRVHVAIATPNFIRARPADEGIQLPIVIRIW
jgi:hypothetical protein